MLLLLHSDERDAVARVQQAASELQLDVQLLNYATQSPIELAVAALQGLTEQAKRQVLILPLGDILLRNQGIVRFLVEKLVDLERIGHSVVLLSVVPVQCVELARDLAVLHLPLPGVAELQPLVNAAFSGSALDVHAGVQALRGLTQGQARRALRRIRQQGLQPTAIDELQGEKRDLIAQGGVLDLVENLGDATQVGGLDAVKEWLHRRRRALQQPARDYGLPMPRGVLVLGVQGCGKSLIVKASAQILGLPLVRLDIGRLYAADRAPDELLRQALAVAEAMAPVVLWLDEIDKAFSTAATTPSEEGARIFGSFLTWLGEQRAGVFVAATANRVEHLPPELVRKGRFDEMFFVDLPDSAVRSEILAIQLRRSGRNPAIYDLQQLANKADRLTGAEIEQAVTESLANAFSQDREMTTADIAAALAKTVPFVETYEPQVQALRQWARHRCKPATHDRSLRELYLSALDER